VKQTPNRRSEVAGLLALCLLILIAPATRAEPVKPGAKPEPFQGFTKYEWYRAHYDVNPDGTHVEEQSWAMKVLAEQGISDANQVAVTFSDRLEKVEFLYAYTLKKDGRRIDVPASNFQDQTNTGRGAAAPMFSDLRTKTVAFPDVGVGDSVVVSYKLTQREPTYPGNFSLLQSFSKFEVYDKVDISLSAPQSLSLQVFTRGVQGGEVAEKDGRRNWRWTYHNEQIAKSEPASVSAYDYGPLIAATTFKDYGAIAAAYNARAASKSKVTEQTRKLADELTKGLSTPREQAKTLYEWVSANVDYAGNNVGVGAVVPHEADLIMTNRMGDCKDHVTLLQSLLAAKGITSTPALINARSAYTLPKAPCPELFNHVITYIPSLNLYVDSTAKYTPFGMLPPEESGKPVIYTAAYDGIRHTPLFDYNHEGQDFNTVLNIHPDGSATGVTSIQAEGYTAVIARFAINYLQPNTEEDLIQRALARSGYTGTGTFVRGTNKDFADIYSYSIRYKFDDAMNLPGPGAIPIRVPFPDWGSVATALQGFADANRTVDFACSGRTSKEEFTIHFPPGVKIMAMPRDVHLSGADSTYTAAYKQDGTTITVARELADRTPGPVCTPKDATQFKPFADAVRRDLRAQILYE
jgi:transglutaminase-like putative cysteine protease